MQKIKLIECPRDAMQGWKTFIPTEQKIAYINTLLQVGFDTLDFGSFVSPKAIPQLADTSEVIKKIKMTDTKLLAIVANLRGANEAVLYDEITYIGFPFSISETFQQLNTQRSIAESLIQVADIQSLCVHHNKQLVIYISMGFGNPYGDPYQADIVIHWVEQLHQMGIKIFAISDTVGVSNPTNISYIYKHLQQSFSGIELGAHFHSTPDTAFEKIDAAYQQGIVRFDHAIGGIGGCPMAQNDLVGNLDTAAVIDYFAAQKIDLSLHTEKLQEAKLMASRIFI